MQLIIAFALLGGLLVAGGWLLRPVPPEHLRGARIGTAVVLRPPRGRNAILSVMAIGPTLLVGVVASAASRGKGMGTAGVVLVSLAVAFGIGVFLYFLIAERRMQVKVDARGVERTDPLRRTAIAWAEVEKIAYNGVSRWFFVTGPRGVRLWVPENMAGIGDFADVALAGIPAAVLAAEPATKEALEQLAAEAREEDAAAGKAPA
jgi:Bacterial PH domain